MAIYKRKYKDYKEYLTHQSLKLKIGQRKKIAKFMPDYFDKNVRSFTKRISKFKKYVFREKVLCLGARLGEEVVAFRNCGFDAIGIDLNPGQNNPYVLKGDFHNIEFDDEHFDTVYCNCIDHAWDLVKLSKEINRILVPGGCLILEVDHILKKSKKKKQEWVNRPSKYEVVLCDSLKDIDVSFKDFKLKTSFTSAYEKMIVVIFNKKI